MPFTVRASALASTALLLVLLPIGAVADAAPDGVALARVGTLGRAPSGDDTIVVRVTAEGRIHVGDEGSLGLLALRDVLRARTADRASREPDGSSRMSLLVNADASLPWVVSQWIMQTAADPRVGLYKIFFGARARQGNAAGAIGWRLPKDRGLQPTAQHVTPVPTVSVKVFQNEAQASDPEALFPLLLAGKKKRGTVFEIKTPPPRGPAVPTGFILQVVDVAARAGFDDVRFEGAAGPQGGPEAGSSEWLVRHVAKLRAGAGTPTLRLGAKTIGRLPVNATTPPARGLLDEPYVLAPAAPASDGPEEEPVEEETEKPDPEGADGAGGGVIGLGGGAGGAFRGRGGSRGLRGPEGGKVEAIEAALAWLAAHQSEDGGWDADGFASWCDGERVEQGPDGKGSELHDVGVTGMALLAFLGRGYTNRGKHAYAKVVSLGLRSLKSRQDLEGCFGTRKHQHFVYNHALASLAMVVAYGMTGSPLFKRCAQRALDFIALTRNPYFGWRYGVKPGDNDMSVTGWMALALQAAKLINDEAVSHGKTAPLAIVEEALQGVRNLIEKMTSPETGRTGYIRPGGSSARPPDRIDRFPGSATEAMTAVGLALRGILGEEPAKSPLMEKGFALLSALPPTWEPPAGRIDLVYWYWGALALPHFPVAEGKAWKTALEKALVDHQRRDTTPCLYAGSWDPIGAWGVDGGRVYSTALAAMTLEALGPWPHLTFQRPK